MTNFIEVKDLVYKYSKEQGDDNLCPAIDHVSIEISRGEYIAIAGSNGSGKSTLARCLNGLYYQLREKSWLMEWIRVTMSAFGISERK